MIQIYSIYGIAIILFWTFADIYGFVLQTGKNSNNEYVLIDNLVIETYTVTKALVAEADKKR